MVGMLLRAFTVKPTSTVGSGFALLSRFFRNMPLLVRRSSSWFFVLPELLPQRAGLWLKQLPHAPFWTAAVGVGLFMSAARHGDHGCNAGIGSLAATRRSRPRPPLSLTTLQGLSL